MFIYECVLTQRDDSITKTIALYVVKAAELQEPVRNIRLLFVNVIQVVGLSIAYWVLPFVLHLYLN
jgi:hypothetical protein